MFKSVIHYIHFFILKFYFGLARPNVSFTGIAKLGRRLFIGKERSILIGKNFFCGHDCHISCHVEIGSDVMFASFVSIVGGDHRVDEVNGCMRLSGRDHIKKVFIGNDVWVGQGAIILHGSQIGTGAVIGAGSVVTGNVPSMAIYAGNPARMIRMRKKFNQ